MSKDREWYEWLKGEGLTTRAAHAFYFSEINSLEEIVAHTDYELLRIPNFGRGSLNATKEFLAKRGMTLANKAPFCPIERSASLHAKICGHYNAIASCKKELAELERLT